MRFVPELVISVALCLSAAVTADSLLLTNGDDLHGTVTLQPAGGVRLHHEVLGNLELSAGAIKAGQVSITLSDGAVVSGTLVGWRDPWWVIKPVDGPPVRLAFDEHGMLREVPAEQQPGPGEPTGADLDQSAQEVSDTAVGLAKQRIKSAQAIVDEADKQAKKEWQGSISFGGSLSQGTSDTANVLLNVGMTREVEGSKTDIKAFYLLNTKGSQTTQNWFQASVDHTWHLPDTKDEWSVFALAVFDYQGQASWEQRFNANIGMEYLLVNATRDPGTDWFEKMKIRARVGPGIRKEFAGNYTDPALELLVGGIWDVTFLEKVTLTGNAQVFPDLTDLGQYRVTANAKFKVGLDMLDGLSVGLDFKYQFQSQVDPGTVDYLFVVSGIVEYEF